MTMERRGEILFYSAAGGVVMGARESITRLLMMMALRYSSRRPGSCAKDRSNKARRGRGRGRGCYAGRSAMM